MKPLSVRSGDIGKSVDVMRDSRLVLANVDILTGDAGSEDKEHEKERENTTTKRGNPNDCKSHEEVAATTDDPMTSLGFTFPNL